MASSLACAAGSIVLHAVDAAEDFGEIDGLDGDAAGFEKLFAVADGVEGGGAGADGADAQAAQSSDHAADGGEPGEILLRRRRNPELRCGGVVSEYGMPYWLRLLQADILPQKLSRRSRMDIFEAVSGVAWMSTGTLRSAMRRVSAMARSSPKLGRVTMTPSICVAVFLKEVGALARFFAGFDGAEFVSLQA